jgi:hypothetical protein
MAGPVPLAEEKKSFAAFLQKRRLFFSLPPDAIKLVCETPA